MATKEYLQKIHSLEMSLPLYSQNASKLSQNDLKTLGEAYSIYVNYCESILRYDIDPRIKDTQTFHKHVNPSEIYSLITKLTERANEEDEEEKKETENEPNKENVSIPPELETMVAEYRQNQALLQEQEIKSNSQRSVAEQVKIAIAHSKIKELALSNRERRQSQGEVLDDTNQDFVSLGSPKSTSKDEALAVSFNAVKQVALTYSGFSKLSSDVQIEIINSAVEFNSIGVVDIDTAIQASTLQLETSSLSEGDRQNLATIPGGFVSSVYQEVISLGSKTEEYESKITANEQKIIEIQESLSNLSDSEKVKKTIEIKEIIAENEHLSASIEGQSTRFINTVSKQTELFKDFENSREKRLSQDPDLKDLIEVANKSIATIHNNLEANGVKPQLHVPLDDAILLENAIRHDMPGTLRPNSGNEAEKAAALVNDPKTKSPDLSPQAILLYGKELTPTLLAKARKFALDNPQSALGKLLKNRKDLFDSAGSQLRKIANSPLGKEISKVTSGIGKTFSTFSKSIGKFTDRIPGGMGAVFRVIQDPWGALKSFAGRKAGEFVMRQLSKKITNEALKKTGELLLKNGVSASVKKLAAQVAAKIAIKLGIQIAASSTGVGIILAIAIEILSWLWDKAVGFVNKLSTSIYGEKIKARDLLAVPAVGIASAIAFFASLGSATVAAASSAAATIGLGVLVGFFFYMTSIAVAPLISTLVQLESNPRISSINGCASWPTAGVWPVIQGPLGLSTHLKYRNQAIDISDFTYAIENTEFLAAAPGIVSSTGVIGTYGNTAIIAAETEAGPISMLYAHMNDIYVSAGQTVKNGDVVGTVGGTGGWSPHIHFEYRDVEYNTCPAGDIPVPVGCFGLESDCLYDGKQIITNVTVP